MWGYMFMLFYAFWYDYVWCNNIFIEIDLGLFSFFFLRLLRNKEQHYRNVLWVFCEGLSPDTYHQVCHLSGAKATV